MPPTLGGRLSEKPVRRYDRTREASLLVSRIWISACLLLGSSRARQGVRSAVVRHVQESPVPYVDGPREEATVIEISKSPTADTRTCDYTQVSETTLYRASHLHILDVRRALAFFGWMLSDAAARHDFDKLSDVAGFHADFQTGFKVTEWWDRHRTLNRHHLLQADGVPADVNLIDVLDMIADCIMAGMARAGSVYPLEIPDDVLKAAFTNTVELLKAQVKVRD